MNDRGDTSQAEDFWRAHMPAVDLTKADYEGIPVYDAGHHQGLRCGVTTYENGRLVVFCRSSGKTCGVGSADWRVNLDHGQGFGFGLKWYRLSHALAGSTWVASVGMTRLVDRWLNGQTSDSDRFALARMLAAVSR